MNRIGEKVPVSAVLISFNEENRIAGCLKSLSWADEIVVVDSGSTDKTMEIAREYTCKLFTVSWKGFGPQKQAAVDLASHTWVLNVDCDERVTPELAEEIRSIVGLSGVHAGYSIPRRTFIGGKEIRHCGWYPDRTVRLFDRTRGRFSDQLVHERVIVQGMTGRCEHHLLHYSFDGIGDMLSKMDRYSDLSAREMYEAGRSSGLPDITVRPLFAFLKTYLFRGGFLDGVEGLMVAVSGALHVFVKYLKLRELRKDRREKPS